MGLDGRIAALHPGVLVERDGLHVHHRRDGAKVTVMLGEDLALLRSGSLSVPCVAATTDLEFNPREKTLVSRSRKILREDDEITIDGTRGIVIDGFITKVHPNLDRDFDTFLNWAG